MTPLGELLDFNISLRANRVSVEIETVSGAGGDEIPIMQPLFFLIFGSNEVCNVRPRKYYNYKCGSKDSTLLSEVFVARIFLMRGY